MQTTETLLKGCLVCKREDVQPPAGTAARSLFTKEGKSFARCPGCGLIYQELAPTAEEVQAFYQEGYYEGFGGQSRTIQDARLSIYQNFLFRFESYRQTGRILDIGSGHGDFLTMAEERGWEGWGIEPSRRAWETAQKFLGARVLNQSVEAAQFPENHFDVITLWNVIDCLPDPTAVVQKAREWLAPGGVLVIRTPNVQFHLAIYQFYNRFKPLLKKLGWTKEASVFLRNNFDSRTLRRFLKESGFQTVRIQNGIMAQGDAYRVFSRSIFMQAGKAFIYNLACLVDILSGNRVLMGSNLIAFAVKGRERKNYDSRARALAARVRIKKTVLHLFSALGYLLGLSFWRRLFGKDREIRILCYHSVNEFRSSDVNVRESEFRKQMDFLTAHYSVISLEEAVNFLEKGSLPPSGAIVVTFDDGTEDNYRVAYPILREKGIPATVFLITGGEGPERKLPHIHDGESQYNRLLGWNQIREMAQSRIEFGSHSHGHSRLSQVSGEKSKFEILISKKKIEGEISRPARFFSYPYGTDVDFNPSVESWVREAGYRAAASAIFGANGKGADLFALRRIGIGASDNFFTFRAKLNGALDLLNFFEWKPIRKFIRWLDSVLLKEPPTLLVSVDFPPHTDGVSTISKELSERLTHRGREMIVIGPKDKGDKEFDRRQPYRVFRVPGYEWGYLRFLPIFLAMPFIVLASRVKKIFAMNIAYGGILSWALSFIQPLDYLIFAYGYEFEKVKTIPSLKKLYLSIYRRSKGIVACSELVRKRLIEFGVDREKIHVLYPAVDLNFFRPHGVPREFLERNGLIGRKILLTVGRLIERKGHDRVIQALPKVIQRVPDLLYCIVGIGSNEGNLRRQIREMDLESRVRLMGKVPNEELVYLYNACKIFIMPSREILDGGHIEGFGIVYLEANACGKPVIGGRSGGIREAVRDGETGLLVDPDSVDDIAEKIVTLLAQPEEAERLGAEGLAWVRNSFGWENYIKEAYRFLEGEPFP